MKLGQRYQDSGTRVAPEPRVNPRERWQALQARLTAARSALEAGDREQALAEVNAALELDPNFLAAVSLRERLVGAEAGPTTWNPDATRNPLPDRFGSPASYARLEQRAKRRRVDHRLEAARAAIACRRLHDAVSALDEVTELDPNLPELAVLTAELDDLRRRTPHRPLGPTFMAAGVFAVVLLGARWLDDPQFLLSWPSSSAAVLVNAATPEPITVVSDDDAIPVATTGQRPPERPAPAAAPVPAAALAQAPARVPALAVSIAPLSQPSPPASTPIAQPVPRAMTVAPGATVIIPPAATDQAEIQRALQQYRVAYGGLDVRSAHAVYPAVNEAALARAFGELESQTLTFDACSTRLRGEYATAVCRGSARWVPKIGSREARTEPRSWTFALRKSGAAWTIESARAER